MNDLFRMKVRIIEELGHAKILSWGRKRPGNLGPPMEFGSIKKFKSGSTKPHYLGIPVLPRPSDPPPELENSEPGLDPGESDVGGPVPEAGLSTVRAGEERKESLTRICKRTRLSGGETSRRKAARLVECPSPNPSTPPRNDSIITEAETSSDAYIATAAANRSRLTRTTRSSVRAPSSCPKLDTRHAASYEKPETRQAVSSTKADVRQATSNAKTESQRQSAAKQPQQLQCSMERAGKRPVLRPARTSPPFQPSRFPMKPTSAASASRDGVSSASRSTPSGSATNDKVSSTSRPPMSASTSTSKSSMKPPIPRPVQSDRNRRPGFKLDNVLSWAGASKTPSPSRPRKLVAFASDEKLEKIIPIEHKEDVDWNPWIGQFAHLGTGFVDEHDPTLLGRGISSRERQLQSEGSLWRRQLAQTHDSDDDDEAPDTPHSVLNPVRTDPWYAPLGTSFFASVSV